MIFTATWKQNSGFNWDGNLLVRVGRPLVGKVRGHNQTGAGAKVRDDISTRTPSSFTVDLSSTPLWFLSSSDAPSLCLCGRRQVTRSVIRPAGPAPSHIDRARSPPWLGDGQRRGRRWTLDAARCTSSFSKRVKSNVELPARCSGGLMLMLR